MCLLTIKVPIRKKSGNLSYALRITIIVSYLSAIQQPLSKVFMSDYGADRMRLGVKDGFYAFLEVDDSLNGIALGYLWFSAKFL